VSVFADGRWRDAGIDIDLDDEFGLRNDTALSGRGAWFTACITVDAGGEVDVHFDYETCPAMDADISPADVADELHDWPRDPQWIPAWCTELLNAVDGVKRHP
jgi:hypothetical protein